MKSVFLFFSCIICTNIVSGQSTSEQYSKLIKKADHFYRTKNYKNSASTYSSAFKTIGYKVSTNDRYNAACVWALANKPDSSFFHLNHIATNDNYINYDQITNEHDLNTLHKDKRWKLLIENIKENIKKKEAKLNKPLIKQLDSILNNDQTYRQQIKEIEKKHGWNSKEMKDHWKIIHKHDSINLIKIEAIIDDNGWLGSDIIGEKGNRALFLVIQHSDQKTQEKYLPIMREAVKNGKAYASDLALLEDRVALKQGKKQIYGSQIIKDSISKKDIVAPIEDEENVDKRRAEAGLEPLENYVKQWGIIYKSKAKQGATDLKPAKSNTPVAIEILDSITGPVNVTKGEKTYLIFSRTEGGSVEEESSIWFKFTMRCDTLLTFDIIPEHYADDYDFALFKCSSTNCINDIRAKKVRPERYCLSANELKNGSTGLSEYEKEKFIGLGPGRGYVSALPVKSGETYYLMLNFANHYWEENKIPKGFTIYFYNYWPKKPKRTALKKVVVLENVHFETNKAILLKESFITLDKLANQLKASKTMKIEIIGHTDNIGDETKNQLLSENRAREVVNYLTSKGIDKNRLSYKGMGSKQPVDSNDTEDGRKKNRRVEFSIKAH